MDVNVFAGFNDGADADGYPDPATCNPKSHHEIRKQSVSQSPDRNLFNNNEATTLTTKNSVKQLEQLRQSVTKSQHTQSMGFYTAASWDN